MSIVQATISTYEGAAKAFAQGGIFGHIFGAVIIAAGLALVAKIKSQPIPLAKGAIFDKSTLLPATDGRTFEVGEAGTEIVATPENIRKALKIGGQGDGRGTTQVWRVTIPVYVGGAKLDERIVEVIQSRSQTGRIQIHSKAVR